MRNLMIILVMVAAAFALPTMAQQEWQSTSSMQTSGSAYSPQVTAVGATAVPSEATTTGASYTPGRPGTIKRGYDDTAEPGEAEEGSPLGDAVLPLLALACVYMVYSAVRRKRSARV